MTDAPAPLSLGVAAALGPGLIADIAARAEAAGFHALWVNDTPGADALAALRAAAGVTRTLGLATGVVPLDRRPAAEVVAAAQGLPADRLTLGVGSGATRRGALDLVSGSIPVLRDALGCRILVGALGPRMRRLGAAAADGVLLSWLPPGAARAQAAQAHAEAAGAHAALYVRTALDPAGEERMRVEAERYAALPQYGANLARLQADVHDTVLAGTTPGAARMLTEYRAGVDEVVLRAIVAEDTLEAYTAFVAGAARFP